MYLRAGEIAGLVEIFGGQSGRRCHGESRRMGRCVEVLSKLTNGAKDHGFRRKGLLKNDHSDARACASTVDGGRHRAPRAQRTECVALQLVGFRRTSLHIRKWSNRVQPGQTRIFSSPLHDRDPLYPITIALVPICARL